MNTGPAGATLSETEHQTQRMAQSLRFIVAGAIASLMSWLIRIAISIVVPFGPAVALSYCIGMVLGFVLYRSWVFEGTALPLWPQMYRFLLVNALGLLVVTLSAKALLIAIDWVLDGPAVRSEALAHGFAIALGGFTNFFGHRGLTFAKVENQS